MVLSVHDGPVTWAARCSLSLTVIKLLRGTPSMRPTQRRAPMPPSATALSALSALAIGRLQRYARSGFKRLPTEHLEPALHRLTT